MPYNYYRERNSHTSESRDTGSPGSTRGHPEFEPALIPLRRLPRGLASPSPPPELVLNFSQCGRLAFENPTPEAHERMAGYGSSPDGPWRPANELRWRTTCKKGSSLPPRPRYGAGER